MDVKFVKNILENADDVSIDSPEIYGKWINDQTEYHLNPNRTNILRSLNLEPKLNVLEIGCSCGILSRYLGEQGCNVLAIDDQTDCLEAAQIRCESLSNVTFLPGVDAISAALKNEYDLILLNNPLIRLPEGILGKDTRQDVESSLCDDIAALLTTLKNALSEEGVIVIGTSNRLGLKYWFGSTEENYGKPFIGLLGYGSQNQNARNYSYNEWSAILRNAGLTTHRFLYPFPDHRFADVVLSDDFISTDSHAHSLLYRMKSSDYGVPRWLPGQDEFLYWKSLHQSEDLTNFTNSFLMVMGNSPKALAKVFPYDFIKLSKSNQHSRYHTLTYKEKDQSLVIKKTIRQQREEGDEYLSTVSHEPSTSDYIQGPLLAAIWIDSLVVNDEFTDFHKLLTSYYQFLLQKLEATEQPGQYLDLLPFNIVVDESGKYKSFDQEWTINSPVTAEFILFRALLWFCFAHDTHISCRMVDEKISNISDFISFCFQLLNLPNDKLVSEYIELEGQVQHSIDENQGREQVSAIVHQPFQQRIVRPQSTLLDTQLFWVTETTPLSVENSAMVKAHIGSQKQTLFFTIPNSVEKIKILRFDPAAKSGFFHLRRLVLKKITKDTDVATVLWEAKGSERIQDISIFENIHYCSGAMGDVFLSTKEQPQIIIELPENVTAETVNGCFQFEVEIDWPQSADYLAVIDEVKTQRRELKELREVKELWKLKELREAKEIPEIKQLRNENETYRERILNLSENVAVLKYKMELIRKSRLGKILKVFRV